MNFKLLTIMILGLAMLAYPASAHFDNSWDWHNVTVNGTSQYKTTVHYCFDASVNDTWKTWLKEAAKNWNDAGTGWTLTQGPPCQVTIKVEDIKDQSGGAYVSGFDGADASGRISNLTMVFDSNLSDQLWDGKAPDGWGTKGNNSLDPVVVAKHEFSHVLRMKHSGAGVDTNNLEDPVTPGNHNHTVSPSDKREAQKGTVTRGANVSRGNIGSGGGNIRFGRTTLILGEGSLYGPAEVILRPLSHMSTPYPDRVPPGSDGIIIAVDIRTLPPVEGLEVPARVTISYDDMDLAGAYFLGDLQITPMGPLDESSLKAFSYDPETQSWSELSSTLDTDASTVTFDITELGFVGVGARRLQVPGPQVISGIVREITHSESGGLSTLQVEDKTGELQTVTIPISEGKAIKVGDEVEITVYTVGAGVFDIGDLLTGTITGIQNVVSQGSEGVSLVTITTPEGMEYVISIPFAEGDLLSVGEDVKIPVTGQEDDQLHGAGTMTAGGENVTDVIEKTGPTELKGVVTGIRHTGGRSVITISDPDTGIEHEVSVPVSEGEKIKLGVNVRVKILKSADGAVEDIQVIQTDKSPGFGAVLALLAILSLLMRRRI